MTEHLRPGRQGSADDEGSQSAASSIIRQLVNLQSIVNDSIVNPQFGSLLST